MNLLNKILILILINIVFFSTICAQKRFDIDAYDKYLESKYPEIKQNKKKLSQNYYKYIKNKKNDTYEDIISIPIVFHIVGESAFQKLTNNYKTRLLEQIKVLNEDFRKIPETNGDGIGVDTKIEFCLAIKDWAGNNTEGVTISRATLEEFDFSTYIKADNSRTEITTMVHWFADMYLNIYITELSKDIIGNSWFPWWGSGNQDGIIMDVDYLVGGGEVDFNLGRSLTHEIGHWLGLYHPWSKTDSCINNDCLKDGDEVCDTPPENPNDDQRYECKKRNTCEMDDEDDMIENYMGYVPDWCMNAFTQGQADRMRYYLEFSRNYKFFAKCSSHCNDNLKNEDETEIDCGGMDCLPCDWAPPEIPPDRCADCIQNDKEEGIDCGGSCTPCNFFCSAPPQVLIQQKDVIKSELKVSDFIETKGNVKINRSTKFQAKNYIKLTDGFKTSSKKDEQIFKASIRDCECKTCEYVSNIITLNNDGFNDMLCFNSKGYSSYSYIIYNYNGIIIQSGTDATIYDEHTCFYKPSKKNCSNSGNNNAGTYSATLKLYNYCNNSMKSFNFDFYCMKGKKNISIKDTEDITDSVDYFENNIYEVKNIKVNINNLHPQVIIMPNPNNGIFSLIIDNMDVNSIYCYEIRDLIGNLLFKDDICKDKEKKIDASNFAKGMYLVKIIIGEKVFIEKVIIE